MSIKRHSMKVLLFFELIQTRILALQPNNEVRCRDLSLKFSRVIQVTQDIFGPGGENFRWVIERQEI